MGQQEAATQARNPLSTVLAAAFGELIRRDAMRLGKVVKESGAAVD